ncbi:MAG: nuclear transport factor 2 family protein [Chlorobi bacterium]|nr:nuclear transport factor 2 family protein [Chlorobiota bacterium]
MKQIFFIVFIFLLMKVTAQNAEQEKEAIKRVIQTAYVEGLQNEGDAGKIDSGIHPDFNLLGIDKGNAMWKYSIKDWKTNVLQKQKKGELPRTGKDKVSVKFKSIDVTGTAAMAKIEFYVGEKFTYVDYISLYKFSDGWKMVNKIFYKL